MLEKQIENYLTKQVNALGGMTVKLTGEYCAGIPDRLVILPGGVIFFVELKRPGGKLRPIQKLMHRRLSVLGCRVFAADGYEAVREMLEEMQEEML